MQTPYEPKERTIAQLTYPQIDANEGLEEMIIDDAIQNIIFKTIFITGTILLILMIARM